MESIHSSYIENQMLNQTDKEFDRDMKGGEHEQSDIDFDEQARLMLVWQSFKRELAKTNRKVFDDVVDQIGFEIDQMIDLRDKPPSILELLGILKEDKNGV